MGRADPKHRESDTVVHRGHITKQGSKLVRWAAVEAIQRYPTTSKIALDRTRIESAAARTSPRSPRHANCSPWSTTGCATDISARSTVPGRREHPGRNTRAAAALSDPLPGVVANLIDPACCHRTAPCPHQLGEGMTGSRTQSGPAPTYLPITLGEGPHTNTISPLIVRHPPTACIGPARRQDRSSSLRCGRCVLTPALTQCCLHGARKPAKPLLDNLLTHPAPSGMTILIPQNDHHR